MDKYYYLTASLPLLKFTEAPLITREDFTAEAEKWLSGEDFFILICAIREIRGENLLRGYKEFEYSTRDELALFRTARRQNIEYKMRKDLSGIIQEDINPLEIERKLLLLRWNFLEEQEIEHCFDLDFLIIYYLKLQILERLASFNKEKGKEIFENFSKVEL